VKKLQQEIDSWRRTPLSISTPTHTWRQRCGHGEQARAGFSRACLCFWSGVAVGH